eukprot:3786154-Pleurochrysis_carterae.AAC.1
MTPSRLPSPVNHTDSRDQTVSREYDDRRGRRMFQRSRLLGSSQAGGDREPEADRCAARVACLAARGNGCGTRWTKQKARAYGLAESEPKR